MNRREVGEDWRVFADEREDLQYRDRKTILDTTFVKGGRQKW
jgi:hypothetical protein